jgi:alanyl aminopeptidase
LSYFSSSVPRTRLQLSGCPDIATPERYDWHVAIDPRASAFDGSVLIDVRFKAPSGELWLNATALEIGAVTVEQDDRVVDVTVVPGGEDFVGLKGEFAAGPARIRILYRGKVDDLAVEGIFRQREGGDWYVFTQFQAIGARRAVPCFDEPGWKTPWRLTVDAPASELAVANTPQTSAAGAARASGMVRHEFAESKPLPSYLVALAVGPFDVLEGGTAGRKRTPLRYLALRGRGEEARYAKSVTPRLLEALEDYFGTPYPFEKLDSITIPQTCMFGAMENVGLITYASQLMLRAAARGDRAVPRDLCRPRCPRDRPHVVRQPRDARLVGRHVAERVLRIVDRVQGDVRVRARRGTTA